MCRSMVDIQSATLRLGEEKQKKKERKEPQGKNIMASVFHTAAIKSKLRKFVHKLLYVHVSFSNV